MSVTKSTKDKSSQSQLEFNYEEQPTGVSQEKKAKRLLVTPHADEMQSLIDSQYAGIKADLRPLYNLLAKLCSDLGKDVRIVPGKSNVAISRNRVFAQIKASTNTRIDLSLALGKTKAVGRLIDTGGYAKGERITHRIPVSTRADIDNDVKKWIKAAYELDA